MLSSTCSFTSLLLGNVTPVTGSTAQTAPCDLAASSPRCWCYFLKDSRTSVTAKPQSYFWLKLLTTNLPFLKCLFWLLSSAQLFFYHKPHFPSFSFVFYYLLILKHIHSPKSLRIFTSIPEWLHLFNIILASTQMTCKFLILTPSPLPSFGHRLRVNCQLNGQPGVLTAPQNHCLKALPICSYPEPSPATIPPIPSSPHLFQSLNFVDSPSSASRLRFLSFFPLHAPVLSSGSFLPLRHLPCHSHFQSIQSCQLHLFFVMALIIPFHWIKAFRDSPLPTKLKRNPWSGAQVSVFYGLILWLLPPTTTYSAWQATVHGVTRVGRNLTTKSPALPIQGLPRWHSGKKSTSVQGTQKTWVWSLGQEDPLEEEMATCSSILAWKITWTEEPGGLQSMGSQRARHSWVTERTSAVYSAPNYKDLDCFPQTFHTLPSQWLSQAHLSS